MYEELYALYKRFNGAMTKVVYSECLLYVTRTKHQLSACAIITCKYAGILRKYKLYIFFKCNSTRSFGFSFHACYFPRLLDLLCVNILSCPYWSRVLLLTE